jgi:hypothetical protein
MALQGLFGLIDDLLRGLLHLAGGLVDLAFATKLLVVGHRSCGFLDAPFHFFCFA